VGQLNAKKKVLKNYIEALQEEAGGRLKLILMLITRYLHLRGQCSKLFVCNLIIFVLGYSVC
jgi:hypothetical protein